MTRNRPDGFVAQRLDLALADHARLRVEAAKRGMSMASLTREIVVKWLDEVNPLPQPKTPKPRKQPSEKNPD